MKSKKNKTASVKEISPQEFITAISQYLMLEVNKSSTDEILQLQSYLEQCKKENTPWDVYTMVESMQKIVAIILTSRSKQGKDFEKFGNQFPFCGILRIVHEKSKIKAADTKKKTQNKAA